MRRDVSTLSIHHTKSFIIFEQINFARFIYQRVYIRYIYIYTRVYFSGINL